MNFKKSLLIAVWLAAAASFGIKYCKTDPSTLKPLPEVEQELEKKVKKVFAVKKKKAQKKNYNTQKDDYLPKIQQNFLNAVEKLHRLETDEAIEKNLEELIEREAIKTEKKFIKTRPEIKQDYFTKEQQINHYLNIAMWHINLAEYLTEQVSKEENNYAKLVMIRVAGKQADSIHTYVKKAEALKK